MQHVILMVAIDLQQALSQTFVKGGVRPRRRGGWGVGRGVRGLGRGCVPENFWSFSLEMARFRANSVVCFNRHVRLFRLSTAKIMTVTVYCWQLGIVPGAVSESLNGWLSGLGRGLLKISEFFLII